MKQMLLRTGGKLLRVGRAAGSRLAAPQSFFAAVSVRPPVAQGLPPIQGIAVAAAAFSGVAVASCEADYSLPGLKSIKDAKEIVLYQYAVCPFCNKASALQHLSGRLVVVFY